MPDGVVVPAGVAFTSAEAIEARDRLGPGPWAVRSSSVAEDLADASFAGQYETVLNVTTPEGVVDAVARVRASASTAHAADYQRAQAGDARASMAVLVQQQVGARAAGVAFSANPVTGADEVIIEAVPGLGDRLASGDADAERWIDVGGSARPVVATGTIDQTLAQRIAVLARRVALERGSAQDIEWAYDGTDLYLLQARAITGLPKAPAFEVPPGRWVKDTTHWTGPITPAGASILLPVLEQAFARFLPSSAFPWKPFACGRSAARSTRRRSSRVANTTPVRLRRGGLGRSRSASCRRCADSQRRLRPRCRSSSPILVSGRRRGVPSVCAGSTRHAPSILPRSTTRHCCDTCAMWSIRW